MKKTPRLRHPVTPSCRLLWCHRSFVTSCSSCRRRASQLPRIRSSGRRLWRRTDGGTATRRSWSVPSCWKLIFFVNFSRIFSFCNDVFKMSIFILVIKKKNCNTLKQISLVLVVFILDIKKYVTLLQKFNQHNLI